MDHFKDLTDPRRQGKADYPLPEVLLPCLLGVLAGAETITGIALFGRTKPDLLRRINLFANGTPAHGHLGDLLTMLDPEQFQRCFTGWMAALIGTPEGAIAIDGKTARRSGHKRQGQSPNHMVSAFAARQRLVLGQVKVAKNSNEIVATPRCWRCRRSRARSSPSMPPAASATSPRRWRRRRRPSTGSL